MPSGPVCKPTAATETDCSGASDDDCDGFIDCLDPDCEAKACGDAVTCLSGACLGEGPLPELPRIDNLVPTVRGDTAIIDFTPVMGAADYRIYPLPAEGDILVGTNGEVVVKDAVYRCGGAFPRSHRARDGVNVIDASLKGNVHGFMRAESDSLLGYVYLSPGADRLPIYRVANPNSIGGYAWEHNAPPTKEHNGADYVQGVEARDALLAQGWRDDGIAFYVPASGARAVYRAEYKDNGVVAFYTDGKEKDARKDEGSERFKILAEQADGSVPLYRIYYAYHHGHDNLAAGDAYRDRVLNQGQVPVNSLTWPKLEGSTTLVIEALDQGCPFPNGFIGAMSAPAALLGSVPSLPTITLDEARLPSTGEVFVNGQYEPTNRPKPIARAYVTVEPKPRPEMDWFEGFDSNASLDSLEKIIEDGNGTVVLRNEKYSVEFIQTNKNYSYGALLGQFAAGASTSFYVAALGANAKLASDSYLHATMSVDVGSSNRRYPQLWITDTPLSDPAAVKSHMVPFEAQLGPRPFEMLPPGPYRTINAQVFSGSPELQIQFCDLRGWGVSQQCPKANIYGYPAGDPEGDPVKTPWFPLPVPGEYAGMDRLVKFDVYASTERVYLFVEDRPAGCAVLPAGRMPAGPVNVIFGSAAYHIEIDEYVVPANSQHQYWSRYSVGHSERKMDDLGVKTGVTTLPAWNEAVIPCATEFHAPQLQ